MQIISKAWARVLAIFGRTVMPPIDLGDVQILVALFAITYGVAQYSTALAWITCGGLLLAGWLLPRLPRAKKGS